jgi:hypothetical protein
MRGSKCYGTSGSVIGQEQKQVWKKIGIADVFHSAWNKYKVFVSWRLAGHSFGVVVRVWNKFGQVCRLVEKITNCKVVESCGSSSLLLEKKWL